MGAFNTYYVISLKYNASLRSKSYFKTGHRSSKVFGKPTLPASKPQQRKILPIIERKKDNTVFNKMVFIVVFTLISLLVKAFLDIL